MWRDWTREEVRVNSEVIRKLRNEQFTIKSIADRFDISPDRVSYILKYYDQLIVTGKEIKR